MRKLEIVKIYHVKLVIPPNAEGRGVGVSGIICAEGAVDGEALRVMDGVSVPSAL